MKFYEVRQQMNNLQWLSCGFFRKRSVAEKCEKQFNTGVTVHRIKIVEHEFTKEKDVEE